jgi:peptidyl-dipeptidase Dcp
VPFPSISGSAGTPRDYREFPSQFFERYATDTEVMKRYARHSVTGEVMPRDLIAKIQSVEGHNQGFKTSESIAAAMLDMEWHQLPLEQAQAVADVLQFENQVFGHLGPLPEIGPRYRSAYFTHVFSGSYPAGYYAYLWSEVLDSDAYGAFQERGNLFDSELAQRLKVYIYEAGAREDADVLYRKFRGKDPDIRAFLELRGLDAH